MCLAIKLKLLGESRKHAHLWLISSLLGAGGGVTRKDYLVEILAQNLRRAARQFNICADRITKWTKTDARLPCGLETITKMSMF